MIHYTSEKLYIDKSIGLTLLLKKVEV